MSDNAIEAPEGGQKGDNFARERAAYAHLVHFGVCDKGTVPKCYGWLELTKEHIKQIMELPTITGDARSRLYFRSDLPPRAIILEYFPSAVKIDIENVTEPLADLAVRGICEIHAAYVWHGDIHPRNILILPDSDPERVVWIDFDHSVVPCYEPRLTRLSLLDEAASVWACMYQDLVRVLITSEFTAFELSENFHSCRTNVSASEPG